VAKMCGWIDSRDGTQGNLNQNHTLHWHGITYSCYYCYITSINFLTADLTILTIILLIVLLFISPSVPDPAQVNTLKFTVRHTLRVEIITMPSTDIRTLAPDSSDTFSLHLSLILHTLPSSFLFLL
jgi:hypothetical protein